MFILRDNGNVVGWDTMLQAGKTRVHFPTMSPNSTHTVALWLNQSLTEINTTNIPGGKELPARKADLIVICELVGYQMRKPRHFKSLLVSTGRYRGRSTFYINIYCKIYCDVLDNGPVRKTKWTKSCLYVTTENVRETLT
jgi:hypothetical protein